MEAIEIAPRGRLKGRERGKTRSIGPRTCELQMRSWSGSGDDKEWPNEVAKWYGPLDSQVKTAQHLNITLKKAVMPNPFFGGRLPIWDHKTRFSIERHTCNVV